MARNLVLLVDDHPDWLASLKKCMPNSEIIEAHDLGSALRIIEEKHSEILIGIFDLCLPTLEENSVPAARKLREFARMEVLIFGITAEETLLSHFHTTVDGLPLCNDILSKDMSLHILRALDRLGAGLGDKGPHASHKWLHPRGNG